MDSRIIGLNRRINYIARGQEGKDTKTEIENSIAQLLSAERTPALKGGLALVMTRLNNHLAQKEKEKKEQENQDEWRQKQYAEVIDVLKGFIKKLRDGGVVTIAELSLFLHQHTTPAYPVLGIEKFKVISEVIGPKKKNS